MPYTPLAIANEFIKLANEDGVPVEHMKLQKLVHFALGYSLVDDDTPVVVEGPQVWKFGPVFKSLYHELKYHGRDRITEPEMAPFFGRPPEVPSDDIETKTLLRKVWNKYGRKSAFTLSDLTHKEGSPWYQVVLKHGGKVPTETEIPMDVIKDHYRGLPPLE